MVVIVVGSLGILLGVILVAVFIPAYIHNPQPTTNAHPFTPEEYRGFTLYYQNQCWTCHTLYSRLFDNSGYPVSQAGDYFYFMPLPLGSERTGPDLSDIGRKRSESWEIEHYKSPRAMMPNSIMPNFYWMPDRDLEDLSNFLFNQGDRVAGEQMIQPPIPYTNNPYPLLVPDFPPQSASAQLTGFDSFTAAGLQQGKELYVARCLDCHGCAGNGLGYYAGKLIITPANFKAEPFRSMTDSEWFWHVSEGVPASTMPAWKMSDLTEDQRWLIIKYIQTVFANPVARNPNEGNPSGPYIGVQNPLPLNTAVLEEAKAIWLRECMICHNDTGTGNGTYSAGLQPPPPNFHDPATYNSYTDADWYWRISEGIPWTAMPSWKMKYSDADRWKLVHYIRVNFAMTEPRPPVEGAQFYPAEYLSQQLPASGLSFEQDRDTYLNNCAKCHGLDGKGNGWLGAWLAPPPADFTAPHIRSLSPGAWLAKESFGVQNTAMPVWNEFLTEGQRWSAIQYIIDAFVSGMPDRVSHSYYDNGQVAATYSPAGIGEWMDEGNTVDPTNGQVLYGTFCVQCHGAVGLGSAPAKVSGGIVPPFPAGMDTTYIFWRTSEGIPHTPMYPFLHMRGPEGLSEGDIWDIVAYVASLVGTNVPGVSFGVSGG